MAILSRSSSSTARSCKGFKIIEFPIIFEDRKVGKSKMNKKIVFEALGRVWGFRWRALKQGRLGRMLSHSQKLNP